MIKKRFRVFAKGFGQLDSFVNADKLKAAIQPDEPSEKP